MIIYSVALNKTKQEELVAAFAASGLTLPKRKIVYVGYAAKGVFEYIDPLGAAACWRHANSASNSMFFCLLSLLMVSLMVLHTMVVFLFFSMHKKW